MTKKIKKIADKDNYNLTFKKDQIFCGVKYQKGNVIIVDKGVKLRYSKTDRDKELFDFK